MIRARQEVVHTFSAEANRIIHDSFTQAYGRICYLKQLGLLVATPHENKLLAASSGFFILPAYESFYLRREDVKYLTDFMAMCERVLRDESIELEIKRPLLRFHQVMQISLPQELCMEFSGVRR